MKKSAIVIICIIIILIASLGATVFAFYQDPTTQFEFYIQGATGSVLQLTINSQTGLLKPAKTNSAINTYSTSAQDRSEYVVYVLRYAQADTQAITVDFFIEQPSIKFRDNTQPTIIINNDYVTPILPYIKYTIVRKDDANYVYSAQTDPLPSAQSTLWRAFNSADKITINNIPKGQGCFLLYIKIDVVDELLPPVLNNTSISFNIKTTINSGI